MITVNSIPQLIDNYSYIIAKNNKAVIIDPAESSSIIEYINKYELKIVAILLTHHHKDHTAGVENILKKFSIPVYSPNKNINGTNNIIRNSDVIDLQFTEVEVITTPGHTLDHVIFFDKINKILFSGDTLFRLGCGRVFEGTNEQMYKSLLKIRSLDNETSVYCGHEYTLSNLNFLISTFPNHHNLFTEKNKISEQISKNKSSIPFNLGKEKEINPFLSTKSEYYEEFKRQKNLSDLDMFSYLRELKNNY